MQACWSITQVSAPPLHLRESVQKALLCEKGMQGLSCQFPHQSGERSGEILALTSCSYKQTHIQSAHTSQSSVALSIRGFLTLLWWDTLLLLTLDFSSHSSRNREVLLEAQEKHFWTWTSRDWMWRIYCFLFKRRWTSVQNGHKKSSPRDSGTLEKAWDCK